MVKETSCEMSSSDDEQRVELIKKHIGEFPDFPKKGILFKDIFTALKNGKVCIAVKELFVSYIKKNCPDVDVVAGIEARGFLFGMIIAAELGISFVPIRKKGKLPGECISVEYVLEYGTDTLEIQKDSIKLGQKVLIVDDLLATGGTLQASTKLVELFGGKVEECLLLLELTCLDGRKKLNGVKVHSFIQYDDVE